MVRTHPPALREVQSPSTIASPRMVMALSMYPALASGEIRLPRFPAHVECPESRRTNLALQ